MLAAICYDILGERHAQATHIAEQIGTCCIDIDANVVDATHHCVVESMLEFGLVYIVLVLTHADTLRVYLDQLGQRVHEPSAYRHGASHCDILVGELLARYL